MVGVSEAPHNVSYARLDYHQECEAAVNEQINVEYTISYVYHSLYAFFDRDNVGAHRDPEIEALPEYGNTASLGGAQHKQSSFSTSMLVVPIFGGPSC